MLKDLGLLEYWEKQVKAKKDRLFSTLSFTESKEWTGKIRSWWNEQFSKEYVDDTDGKSFHSLRKCFINWFKQSGVYNRAGDRDVVRSMIGHDEDDVTSEHYETSFPVKTQYRMMVKLNYGFPTELMQKLKDK
jgi:integrase